MTDIILSIVSFLKNSIWFLLPDAIFVTDIFTNFASYLNFFTDFLVKVNFLVPLPTIFMCLRLILTIKIIKFGIFMFNWFVRAVLDVIP